MRSYHLSANEFEEFRQQYRSGPGHSDVGFHFGSKATALTVGDKLEKEGRVVSGDPVYLYKVDLDLGNVLRLKENRGGSWSVHDILRAIFDPTEDGEPLPDGFSEDDLDGYYDDEVIAPSGENLKDLLHAPEEEVAEFIEWLHARGIDSVSYDNRFEGGGRSYIVFDPERVEILDVEKYRIG